MFRDFSALIKYKAYQVLLFLWYKISNLLRYIFFKLFFNILLYIHTVASISSFARAFQLRQDILSLYVVLHKLLYINRYHRSDIQELVRVHLPIQYFLKLAESYYTIIILLYKIFNYKTYTYVFSRGFSFRNYLNFLKVQ